MYITLAVLFCYIAIELVVFFILRSVDASKEETIKAMIAVLAVILAITISTVFFAKAVSQEVEGAKEVVKDYILGG